jgi:hypothetical protein
MAIPIEKEEDVSYDATKEVKQLMCELRCLCGTNYVNLSLWNYCVRN